MSPMSAPPRSASAPRRNDRTRPSALLLIAALGRSADRFLLLGRRHPARPGLGFGLWQQPEARLTPREVNAHVEQCIGTSARAGEVHDRDHTVGLSGSERRRPSCGMVWGGI